MCRNLVYSPGMRRLTAVAWLAAGAVLAAGGAPAGAAVKGLPHVRSGHRPGPDILYAPPPRTPPQLQSVGGWKAPPILVSGAQSYRKHEWLYQDFLYDDH